MTDPVKRQSEALTKAIKQMELLEEKSKSTALQAARVTRQFGKMDRSMKKGAGSGTDLFNRLGTGLKDTETLMNDLAGIGKQAAAATRDAFGDAFKELLLGGEDFRSVLTSLAGDLSQIGKGAASDIGSVFEKLLLKGKDVKSVLASLETDLMRLGQGAIRDGLETAGKWAISQIFPGFSTGGSFTVGGAAGVDRNLVGLRLTRGEKVTVETPAEARRGRRPGGAGANIALTFNITTPDADSFRRSQAQIQGDALRQAQRQLQRNG